MHMTHAVAYMSTSFGSQPKWLDNSPAEGRCPSIVGFGV